MITGLAPVLVVPSVGAALEHYREKLGFEGEAYAGDPEVYGYARRDGAEIHLARGEGVHPAESETVG